MICEDLKVDRAGKEGPNVILNMAKNSAFLYALVSALNIL